MTGKATTFVNLIILNLIEAVIVKLNVLYFIFWYQRLHFNLLLSHYL